MSTSPEIVDRLAEPLRAPIRHYVTRLRHLGGHQVLGLTVYGAAAAGTFDPERHAIRSALFFEASDLPLLRQLAQEGTHLGKYHIAAPLIMTPNYLRDSCDTFPLEFIEIQQQHVTIFGEEYFRPLEFAEHDVRLQCERELKVILIGMHQGLLVAGGHERKLKELGGEMTEHLIRTLRGLLWLKGIREPRPAVQVVQETEKHLERSLPGLWGALGDVEVTPWRQFCDLYADVQALERFVDAI